MVGGWRGQGKHGPKYDKNDACIHHSEAHSFSTYAEFSEKLTFLTPLISTHMCAYQGVRNGSFRKILRTY